MIRLRILLALAVVAVSALPIILAILEGTVSVS
jgi:hypothetical protein